jgi:hypothetical protein
MPARSTIYQYSPEEREKFTRQLRFIEENRSYAPGLARSVAEEVGCSPPNVYSVLKRSTFNAQIVRAAYAQLCRVMGIMQPDTVPEKGNSHDEKMVQELALVNTLRGTISKDLLVFRDLRNKLRREYYDLDILDHSIQRRLHHFADDLSDMVATEAAGYLLETAQMPPMEPKSRAIDAEADPKFGSNADVPVEILAFLEKAKMDGLLTEEGFMPPETPETEEIGIGHSITDLLPDAT